jgi:hypothetical protein
MASTHTSDADTVQPHQNDTPTKVKLMIHHQCPGIELVSPVYCSNGPTCYLLPDQRVDAGSTVQAGFDIDPGQEWSIGTLIYKLQKKNTDQLDEEETTCIQLIMIWSVNESKEFCVASGLVEHDKDHVWDEDGLIDLSEHYSLFNIQYGPIEETWLMHDNTVLMTKMGVACEAEYYKLEITISETSIECDTQRPWYFDVNR